MINHGARCACIGVQYDNIPNSRNVYYRRFPGWTKEARFIATSGLETKEELDEGEDVDLVRDICEDLSEVLPREILLFNTKEGGAGRCKPRKDRTARVYVEFFKVPISQALKAKFYSFFLSILFYLLSGMVTW